MRFIHTLLAIEELLINGDAEKNESNVIPTRAKYLCTLEKPFEKKINVESFLLLRM